MLPQRPPPPSSIESRRVRERVRELWQRWSLANFCHLPPAKEKASGVWGQGGGQVSGSHSFFQVNADTSRPPWWTLLLLGTSLQWLLEKFLERFQNVLDRSAGRRTLFFRRRNVVGVSLPDSAAGIRLLAAFFKQINNLLPRNHFQEEPNLLHGFW